MIHYEFPNKIVLVTGSSRGIGAAVLSAFARAGATCVLHFWDDPDGTNRKDAETLAGQLRG
ncbi:MAG TPA: beta-ketoacyl-ACP reductase, partial [Gemmata sp.]|nr:beta-ketoacyl-ACP reductase [Gemmata sp.]